MAGDDFKALMTSMVERLPLGRSRPWLVYGCTLGLCALAFVIRLLVARALPVGYPYIAFFPTIMLATFLFGVRPGILAGVVCGGLAWYFFLPPPQAMKLSWPTLFAMAFYSVVVAFNIVLINLLQRNSRRLVAERERNRQLAERGELLFRELQHRVSNNLQVMSGLLQLQMRDVSDRAAVQALEEASRRLALIGRIHRQLYSPHGEQLQLAAFLAQLGADLIDASGKSGVELRVEADEDVGLASDAAVPMALIVAEAVTNAIEHGLIDRSSGLILIRAQRAGDGALEIAVINDGAGLPVDFDPTRRDSLGLKLSEMLAGQLGGTFGLAGGEHTIALLRLP